MKQSSVVLKLDFLKTSDKVVWKFLQWTPGIGWPSTSGQFIDWTKKVEYIYDDGFSGNAGTRGQMTSSSESHIVGSAMRISSGLTIGLGMSNILSFLGE